jgi:hypothetical protein
MNQRLIFAPFLSLMLLTFMVWIVMYGRRIPFILRNKLSPQQMTPVELARLSPPAVSNPSDNFKNLLELPTVFYAMSLYLYVTHQVDAAHLTASWLFVSFRVLHSAVHCTLNVILLRFWMYVFSSAALWFMVVRAAFHEVG